ncbi:MAG: tetratricopeptide repeat protein [Treponema sp.]|nr:tetratricopeptide repeat protein [Treponema sp.]
MKKTSITAFVSTAVVIIIAATSFSCSSTTAHLAVPGEDFILRERISSEYLAIADAYVDLEKYDKAVTYYRLAMKDKKLYWTVYYKLGRTYALAKDWKDAEDVYDEMIERDPKNVNLKLSRAYIKAMSGDLDDAMMIYKSLMEEEPDNEEIIVNYIAILLSQGRAELAETQLDVLKEKFPDNKSISDFSKKINDALKDDGSVPAKEKNADKN